MARSRVIYSVIGVVMTKTMHSSGEMRIIMISDPNTVNSVVVIMTISLESEVLIVSISYEIREMISPA